jgi:hypothetical protein
MSTLCRHWVLSASTVQEPAPSAFRLGGKTAGATTALAESFSLCSVGAVSDQIHQQLVRKALLALDEAIDQAREGPVQPTFALRFVLAWLYVSSDRRRAPYDAFWRCIRDPLSYAWSEEQRSNMRFTQARTAFNGICRSVGIEPTAALIIELSRARRREPDTQQVVAQMIRDREAAQDAANEAKRQEQACGWDCTDPGPKRSKTR